MARRNETGTANKTNRKPNPEMNRDTEGDTQEDGGEQHRGTSNEDG